MNNDLLFLWIPAGLGIAAYIAHTGRLLVRLAFAVAPPLFILAAIYLLGLAGAISNESAGYGLILLMFPLRAFVIALAGTVLLVESFERYRKTRRVTQPPAR